MLKIVYLLTMILLLLSLVRNWSHGTVSSILLCHGILLILLSNFYAGITSLDILLPAIFGTCLAVIAYLEKAYENIMDAISNAQEEKERSNGEED